MTRSADQAVRLGQSYARLAQSQGQPALASQVLAGTMQRAGAAGERSLIGLATQQANLGNSSRNLTSTIAGLGGQLSQLGGSAGSLAGQLGGLAGGFGALGGIGAAIGLGKLAVDMSVAGANADLLRERFDGLAVSAGTTGEALITALRSASGGEINDLNLTLAANKASLLGVADSAEEMGVLMGIARDRAQQMGLSTTQAFDNLTTGLGRGSALILDNLGIIVSVKEANATYAAQLGKTASALTEVEQKQALTNAVLAQGRASLAATGGAVESSAGQFQRMGANVENAKNSIGSFLSIGLGQMASQISATIETTGALVTSIQGIPAALFPTAEAANASAVAMAAFDAEMERSGSVTAAEIVYQQALTEAHQQAAAAAAAAAVAVGASTDANTAAAIAYAQSAALSQQATSAQLGYAESMALGTVQANAATQAAQLKANADQLASVAAQTHAVAQNALAQQAQIAAAALLASGGSGASAAALLAGSSSQVDVLTAAYYRLAAAQAAAGHAATLAKLDKQTPRQLIGAGSEEADLRRGNRAELNADRDARVKAAADAAAAERNYQQVLGNTAPALSRARSELAQLTVGSAAYINKQSEIARLQQQADAASKKAGGGGAGAPKLSDQQKLNNALLADQEGFDNKFEDAELDHRTRLLKINQDFYAKMRAADRDFNQAQLEGRAGFYDQLGSIESGAIRQAASAQYEAASVEAGKIAQEKGADVAEKYMAAQEQVISARAKRLADIEKAEKDKDAGKAEYLRGVDAEYKKAEDAKLARIQEGEGSIAAEKQKQLDSEAATYEQKQGEIADSADRAATKKILASERAGKKIDEEKIKVDGLATSYDRMGQSGTRAGITTTAGATPAAPGTPPAATTATPAASGDNPALAALESIRAAVDAAAAAIVGATRDTTGAVRSLKSSGGIAG